MKIASTLIALLTLSLLATVASAQDGMLKIAIANPARILNEMAETKDLKVKMDNEGKALQQQEREKREKLKVLQEERDVLKPDSAQYGEKNKALLQAAVEFEAWGKIMQADMQRNQKIQMKTLFDKITAATAEVAKKKGIDLVLADQQQDLPPNIDQINVDQLRAIITQRDVLYATSSADLSNDVITFLDAQYQK